MAMCSGCPGADDEDSLSLVLLVLGDAVRERCLCFVLSRGKLVDADADAGADIETDSGGWRGYITMAMTGHAHGHTLPHAEIRGAGRSMQAYARNTLETPRAPDAATRRACARSEITRVATQRHFP